MAIFTTNVAFTRLQKTNSQMEAVGKSWKSYETSHQPIQENNPAAINNNQNREYNLPFMPEANPHNATMGRDVYKQNAWLFGVTAKQMEEYKKTGNVPTGC